MGGAGEASRASWRMTASGPKTRAKSCCARCGLRVPGGGLEFARYASSSSVRLGKLRPGVCCPRKPGLVGEGDGVAMGDDTRESVEFVAEKGEGGGDEGGLHESEGGGDEGGVQSYAAARDSGTSPSWL